MMAQPANHKDYLIRTSSEDYPAIILGQPGKEHPLPGDFGSISRNSVKDHRNVIILGERSGGVRDCLRWWCDVLQADRVSWAFVHGAQWRASLIDVAAAGDRDDVRSKIERVGNAETATDKADALVELAKGAGPFHLVVRDLSGLGDQGSKALGEAFRVIRDLGQCPNLTFVVGSDSESHFADDIFSGLITMSHRYRLMPFSRDEVETLGRTLCSDLTIEADALDEIIRVTGGQQALVRDLLNRLHKGAGRQIKRGDVREAFRAQRRSPPGVTSLWKEELLRLLKVRGVLIDPLRRYVAGATLGPSRFPPPSDERPLMVGGWLRLDVDERWGIASEMHADLARSVLDTL